MARIGGRKGAWERVAQGWAASWPEGPGSLTALDPSSTACCEYLHLCSTGTGEAGADKAVAVLKMNYGAGRTV